MPEHASASVTPTTPTQAVLMYANVTVGGIAVALMLGTYALLGLTPGVPLLVLGGCGAFLIYHLDRAWQTSDEDRLNQPERLAWLRRHRAYVWASSALAGFGIVAMLPFVRPATLGAAVLLGSVGVLYTYAARPGWRLKARPALKPVAIAGAWAVGSVVPPLVEAGVAFSAAALGLVAYRFGFVLANALVADWPDRAGDAEAGVRTLAARMSERQVRRWASAALVLAFVVGASLAFAGGLSPVLIGVDLVGPVLLLGLVRRPLPTRRWFYLFVIDIVIAWPLVTFLVAAVA